MFQMGKAVSRLSETHDNYQHVLNVLSFSRIILSDHWHESITVVFDNWEYFHDKNLHLFSFINGETLSEAGKDVRWMK